MLGHRLWQSLNNKHEVYATCREIRPDLNEAHNFDSTCLIPDVSVEDFNSIISCIDALNPDVVINCIGIIKQKSQAKETIPSILINALFPHLLATLCQAANIYLFHFSTDCVFSGKKGMYTETDVSDAEDLYGRTKYLGEVNERGCITIRSSIIGKEITGQNGLLEWFLSNKGGSVKGFTKAIYSGFTVLEMSRIVDFIIENNVGLSGVWQVASEPISKYDLLSKINSKLKLGITIIPDDSYICDRSLNGEAFNKKTGYSPPSWDEMIDELSREVLS
jgi:dTDP-4-dehydrorhamnose reductase